MYGEARRIVIADLNSVEPEMLLQDSGIDEASGATLEQYERAIRLTPNRLRAAETIDELILISASFVGGFGGQQSTPTYITEMINPFTEDSPLHKTFEDARDITSFCASPIRGLLQDVAVYPEQTVVALQYHRPGAGEPWVTIAIE
jgi:hypothetical protein